MDLRRGQSCRSRKKLLDYMFELYRKLGVPLCLKDLGVAEKDYIPEIPRYIAEDKVVGDDVSGNGSVG